MTKGLSSNDRKMILIDSCDGPGQRALDLIDDLLKENEKYRTALEKVADLADDSLSPRHGPGGCGIYAKQLYEILEQVECSNCAGRVGGSCERCDND